MGASMPEPPARPPDGDRHTTDIPQYPEQVDECSGVGIECSSGEENTLPPPYRSHILDHLGLVAGMVDELGMGEGIDRATQHTPATRIGPAGHAVNALVLNGRGVVNQLLSLGPRFFQETPRSRLWAPLVSEATPRHDDALGRAVDTLDDSDGTALYRLIAATAAARLGRAAPCAHLDSTSFPGDGRDNRDAEPTAQVVHRLPGDSRDHRPDLHHVMLALMIEPHAGRPVLLTPRRGHSSEAHGCGQLVKAHMAQWQTTYGPTDLVADRALDRAANRQQLAKTPLTWSSRVPATWHDAQAALAQADPPPMTPLTEGYRDHLGSSTDGGVAQRWGRIYSAPRHPQAQQTVDRQRRTPGAQEGPACRPLCRTTFACEAAAQQALATLTPGLRVPFLHEVAVRSTPPYQQRGRPRQGTLPAPICHTIEGALASAITARQPRVDRQRGVRLATNALDETRLPVQERFAGDQGHASVERGCRFLKAPAFGPPGFPAKSLSGAWLC
jgi:Domain of unknown function (DUF4277)